MKPEDKELLVRDLCARLPYETIIQATEWATLDTELKFGHIQRLIDGGLKLKPYLRSLSSMTEEEAVELGKLIGKASYNMMHNTDFHDLYLLLEFIYKKHFDYNRLIEKGLAIEAPKDMYK